MTELTREDFDGTFFDVSGWTDEQKIKFQKRCFDLGYKWSRSGTEVSELQAGRYFLGRGWLTFTHGQYHSCQNTVQKYYEDMFQEETPQLDVISEIVNLVQERSSVVEPEEDERGFDGLVVNRLVVPPHHNWVIKLQNLSSDQLKFMEDTFSTDHRYHPDNPSQDVVMGCFYDNVKMWTNCYRDFMPSGFSREITFNDLFQYKEEM